VLSASFFPAIKGIFEKVKEKQQSEQPLILRVGVAASLNLPPIYAQFIQLF
jgi:hypothetical protein